MVRSGHVAALLAAALLLAACTDGGVPPERVAAVTTAAQTAQSGQAPGPIRVAVAGDIACPPGSTETATRCRHADVADLVTELDPDRVIAVGDLQYPRGRLSAFRKAYRPTWGAFRDRTLPVPGNHEYQTPDAAGFYSYFGLEAPAYRVVRVGTWRAYLLDSSCGSIDCAAERRWLRQDLEANPTTCALIAMHSPRFSSGREHGSNPRMARFWRIADRHGVDLALAGHDHDYERFARMNAVGEVTRRGIASFVVGTGGASLYHQGETVPGSRYYRADRFGVLLLRLGDGRFSWRFRGLGGVVRDAGSRACGR